MRALQCQFALLLQTARGVHPDGQVLAIIFPLREVLNVLEVTKRPRKQVSRHDRSLLKAHDLVSILALLGLLLRHVRQSCQVFRDLDLEVEGGLEVRLIEARKCAAGVRGLKLGGEHVVVLIVLCDALGGLDGGFVFGAVEAGHGIVHGASVSDEQLCLLRLRNLLVE